MNAAVWFLAALALAGWSTWLLAVRGNRHLMANLKEALNLAEQQQSLIWWQEADIDNLEAALGHRLTKSDATIVWLPRGEAS